MQFRLYTATCVLGAAFSTVCLNAQTPAPAAPSAAPAARASKGVPPRVSANEYLAHAQVGAVTIGAEFDEHSVPTPDQLLTTEDFVCVEVGLFGAPGGHVAVSSSDFSLRINGKKQPLPVEGFAAVTRNLRDPSYIAPEIQKAKENKSSGLNTGDKPENDMGNAPPIVHIPPEMERSMALKVQSAALPEGDRTLPVAGILFFHYTGATKGIHEVELVYAGAAGKATIKLQ